MHDAGVDLSAHMDLGKAVRRLGVTRQAFIKVRLTDSLVRNR